MRPALANIDVMIDEKLPENATARGAQLMAGLEKIRANNKLIGDVRGKGLMIGIELVKDADKTPAAGEAGEVRPPSAVRPRHPRRCRRITR